MSGRTVQAAVALEELTEKQWQHQVVQLATQLGWTRIYHTHDSRKSAHGFPDLVLVRDRVVFLELKTEAKTSKLTPEQAEWLRALRHAGAQAYVARPRDLVPLSRVLGANWCVTDELDERTREELDGR